jgi:uncharacterized repeat protein (TIGR01451 family)
LPAPRAGLSEFQAPPDSELRSTAPSRGAAQPIPEASAREAASSGIRAANPGDQPIGLSGVTPRPLPGMSSGTGIEGQWSSSTVGERKLEGAQTPMLSIEKIAPEEIQVGKLAKFSLKVRNVGQVPAHGVVVTDRVPQGTQWVESAPAATPTSEGALSWELGTLLPGDESTIAVDLMPQTEGEIGSVAQVTFHAQAAVRTIATRPLLTVEHTGPAKVLIGDNVAFQIAISNPGSGIATGVVVEVDVPEQLMHEGGREIMSDRFDLQPNQTLRKDLVLKAVHPGTVEHVVRVVGDANLSAEHRTQLEVVAPSLQIGIQGPARRYLQRQATYQITVANPGTAAAQSVSLVAYLPQGLQFVSTEKKGQYDQQKHAVSWSLEELPPGEGDTVALSALPVDTGDQKLRVQGTAALDLSAARDHTTVVDALTEIDFKVSDENDPIEVGTETTYEIRVINHGSKIATNVQLAALLPPQMQARKSDGPTRAQRDGDQIVMEPIPQLRPGEEIVYQLTVRGLQAGDHVIRVQVASAESATPVTKEESTKVYADE